MPGFEMIGLKASNFVATLLLLLATLSPPGECHVLIVVSTLSHPGAGNEAPTCTKPSISPLNPEQSSFDYSE